MGWLVECVFNFALVGFPLAAFGLLGWCIIQCMKQSPVTRGIVVALLAWGGIGLFLWYFGTNALYPEYYPLIKAIEQKDIIAVKKMLDRGANPNQWPPTAPEDDNYNTIPLYQAVSDQDSAMVKLLLEHGADPNGRDQWCDPLTRAATDDNVAMMSLLLQYGGGKSKDAALWEAGVEGKQKAVMFLLAQGANPNQVLQETDPCGKISVGDSLCKAVVLSGHPEMVPLLKKAPMITPSKGRK